MRQCSSIRSPRRRWRHPTISELLIVELQLCGGAVILCRGRVSVGRIGNPFYSGCGSAGLEQRVDKWRRYCTAQENQHANQE